MLQATCFMRMIQRLKINTDKKASIWSFAAWQHGETGHINKLRLHPPPNPLNHSCFHLFAHSFPPQFRSFSPNSHNYPTPLLIPAIFFLPSCHSSLPSFYYALKLWLCLAAHKISRPSSLCLNMSCTLHSYRLKPCFCKYILYYVKIHIDQHAYSTWLQTTGAHICFWSACVHNTCLSRSEHLYSDKCSFPLV